MDCGERCSLQIFVLTFSSISSFVPWLGSQKLIRAQKIVSAPPLPVSVLLPHWLPDHKSPCLRLLPSFPGSYARARERDPMNVWALPKSPVGESLMHMKAVYNPICFWTLIHICSAIKTAFLFYPKVVSSARKVLALIERTQRRESLWRALKLSGVETRSFFGPEFSLFFSRD